MLYAVAFLHVPGREIMRGAVVKTANGFVKDIYPLVKESPSMVYLQEAFLLSCEDARSDGLSDASGYAGEIKTALCRKGEDGELVELE